MAVGVKWVTRDIKPGTLYMLWKCLLLLLINPEVDKNMPKVDGENVSYAVRLHGAHTHTPLHPAAAHSYHPNVPNLPRTEASTEVYRARAIKSATLFPIYNLSDSGLQLYPFKSVCSSVKWVLIIFILRGLKWAQECEVSNTALMQKMFTSIMQRVLHRGEMSSKEVSYLLRTIMFKKKMDASPPEWPYTNTLNSPHWNINEL